MIAISSLEENLSFQIKSLRLPIPEREYRFAAHHSGGIGKGLRKRLKQAGLRDWRFDFAWPDIKFAVEVEGGGWSSGRHTRGKGFREDMEKYNAAMAFGWVIYRCDAELIKSVRAIKTIEVWVNNPCKIVRT